MAAPFDIDPSAWAGYVIAIGSLWGRAIQSPKTLLSLSPTDKQLIDATTFYIEMLLVSLVLTAPLILQHKSEFGDKARMVTSALFSLLSMAVTALAGDLAFRLLGGTGTFASTFVAMVYGLGPYGPCMALVSLVIFASVPGYLRPYVLSPVTARKAGEKAMADSRTNRSLFISAGIALYLIMIISYVAFLRCMIFVHNVHGWRAAASIVAFLIGAGILGKAVIEPISGLIMPPPSEEIVEAPAVGA
jgi:hypothetical protein